MKQYLKAGDKFNRLEVICFDHKRKRTYANSRNNHYVYYYLCKCDCGKKIIVEECSLKSGNTKSCGCLITDVLVKRNTKHKLSKTRIYKLYHYMKKRCYDKKCRGYKNYGGRGIKICDEWLSDFMNFYNWATSHGYNDTLSLERKDVNGNYTPQNCTWIPVKEQSKNTRRNVFYEYNGERKILPDWAKEYNLPFTCVRKRLVRGWTLERALNTPKLRLSS